MTGIATARALAARGFPVFPIAQNAKAPPLWTGWPERASTTVPDDFPDGCNVGIHCAGMIVVDVDPKNGGNDSLLGLDMGDTPLPPTLEAATPSGGKHMFYALPAGHPGVPNGAGVLGPGIDIKSTRGYVVGAGSRTAAGEYRWATHNSMMAAPEWLVLKLGTTAPKLGTPKQDVPDADGVTVERAAAWLALQPTGDHAFVTACGLRDRGASLAQALALMAVHDPRPNVPEKVQHAYRYATGEAGAKAVTADDFPTVDLQESVAEERKTKVRGNTLRLTEFAASQSTGPGYLVKGLLTRQSYAELYGPPGAGKTFVALAVAYHVAAALEWMGRKVHQGLVLYLAFEGTGGLVSRAQALRQHYGDADVPFYITAADFNLRELTGRQALGGIIAALPAKPALIVIDTLARAMMGGDENSAQDVGAFNNAVQALIDSTGACVLILHHTGKDKTRGPRGSSALQGAIDTEIEIDGRILIPTKQRDLELSQPIGYKLVTVAVGMDDDGDILTSCVVEQQQAVFQDTVQLSGNSKSGWDTLCMLRPTNEPVTLHEWQEACKEFLGPTNLRKRFHDIRIRLLSAKLIQTDDDGLITRVMK